METGRDHVLPGRNTGKRSGVVVGRAYWEFTIKIRKCQKRAISART
jgi:hypothetical protein